VALDLMGGDQAPEAVIDGALLALDELPAVSVTLVGPEQVARRLLADRGRSEACVIAPATQVIGMGEDPARAVRAKRDATVRVAAQLVRDGGADAMVSVGSTGATMAAALFTLGRLPGVTRPALAIDLPTPAGPVVLLDAGATVEAGPDLLAQYAVAGSAYARIRYGLPHPRVGLLSVGSERSKGDPLRKLAYDVLTGLAEAGLLVFIGNVEGHDAAGGPADVIVTDGFTGNVLLKGMEGAAAMVTTLLTGTILDPTPGPVTAGTVLPLLAEVSDRVGSAAMGGALLGVHGVVVIGHGSSSPRAVTGAIAQAVQLHRQDVLPAVARGLAALSGRSSLHAVTP
jgi:glycerol-3-phosphate acyltransferase PlsX